MKKDISNLDILISIILILIINTFEIIFSVSNTDIYKEGRYLCKVLNQKELLSQDYINRRGNYDVSFTENFIRFKSTETLFYLLRYLIFIPYFILNSYIKNVIIHSKKEKYRICKILNYIFIIIILLFGIFHHYLCIIRCFLIPTNYQLGKRFYLIYEDPIRLNFNFIYCLCADIISFIIICYIYWHFDIYDTFLINNEIEIKTNSENNKTKVKESKTQFEKIPEKELTKTKESNTIEIEELDKK